MFFYLFVILKAVQNHPLKRVLLTVTGCQLCAVPLTVVSQRFHHDFRLCRLKTEAVVTGGVTETIYIHIQSLRRTPFLILNTIRVRHADPEIDTERALKSVHTHKHTALGQFDILLIFIQPQFSLNKSILPDIKSMPVIV